MTDAHQAEGGTAAQPAGRVLVRAPARLALDVAKALEKDGLLVAVHLVEGVDDGQLGQAQRVGLHRVDQEALEGGHQVGCEVSQLALAGDLGRLRHDQVGAIVQGTL